MLVAPELVSRPSWHHRNERERSGSPIRAKQKCQAGAEPRSVGVEVEQRIERRFLGCLNEDRP